LAELRKFATPVGKGQWTEDDFCLTFIKLKRK